MIILFISLSKSIEFIKCELLILSKREINILAKDGQGINSNLK